MTRLSAYARQLASQTKGGQQRTHILGGAACSKVLVERGIYFYRNRDGSEGLEIYAASKWHRMSRATVTQARAERRRRRVQAEGEAPPAASADVPWLPFALAELERKAAQPQWLPDRQSRGKGGISSNTHIKYRAGLRLHEEPRGSRIGSERSPLAGLTLREVTAQRLEAAIIWMYGLGLAPSTIKAYLQPVRAALDLAYRQRIIEHRPFDFVDPEYLPGADATRTRALTPGERRRLLDCARCDRDRCLFLFALGTGFRISELIAIQWRDIDFDARKVRVRFQLNDDHERARLKSVASSRDVFLADPLVQALLEHRVASPFASAGDYIFVRDDGSPITDDHLRRHVFGPARDAAGLNEGVDSGDRERWVVFHTLRHTYASMLIADPSMPLAVIANQLGHQDVQTTLRIYVHFFNEYRSAEAVRNALYEELGSLCGRSTVVASNI
jgi:integrase